MGLPIINLSLIPTFPARVFGSGPVVVTKAGLDYTFSWDISAYSYNPAPSGMAYVLSYDPSTKATELIPVSGVAVDWGNIVNRPNTFPPSLHTHPISQVDNLQLALDALSGGLSSVQAALPGKVDDTDIIDASHGGTGISSYAAGDLIYASATNTLSKRSAGTNGHVLTMAAGVPAWEAPASAPTGTVVNTRPAAKATTSGTSHDYTLTGAITRVRATFAGVSTNGTSQPILQLGTGGAATTTGYLSAVGNLPDSSNVAAANMTSGAALANGWASTTMAGGWVEFSLHDATSNTWVWSAVIGFSNGASLAVTGGSVALAGALNFVRLTTAGGTDAFDAGSFSIEYDTTL